MGKSFKLRFCRGILDSCRSEDSSLLPVGPTFPAAKNAVECSIVPDISRFPTPRRKIDNSSGKDSPFHLQPASVRNMNKQVPRRPWRSSSPESGYFSSEAMAAAEEIETLFSSGISFSTDDSSSSHRRTRSQKSRIHRHHPAAVTDTPARLSMLKKFVPCTFNSRVKKSFAVVKKSTNPYEDFKKSMFDMIVENEMFDCKDLEQLLQCFLSLNAPHYHRLILGAFADILDIVFTPAGGAYAHFL